MTQNELKNFIRATLIAQRTIAQEYIALDAIIDFITQSITSGIPDWTNALTFNLDGSGAGSFSTEPDTNGSIRFWKTKTDGNIGNQPPTNPLITENTYWIEVSPSDGSAIKEWAAGVYGSGLIIVYHNHSVDDRGLYLLLEPVRPFNSTNIETEITAGKWVRIPPKEITHATASGTDTYTATLAPPITSYITDLKAYIKFTNANTGPATINLNGIGAKSIKKSGTTDLVLGDVAAGQILCLVYDGTNFQVVGGGGGGGTQTLEDVLTEDNDGGGLQIKNIADPTSPQDAATKAYADALIVGLWDDRGNFSAAGGAYPSSGGSGTAGAILKGDIWTISVAGTLPTAQAVNVGDTVRALVDTPGNTQANWAIAENNIGYVPENQTNKENSTLDTSSTKYPTNNLVKTYVDSAIPPATKLFIQQNFI